MYRFGLLLCALCGVELGGIAAGAFQMGNATGVVLVAVGANLVPWTAIGGFGVLGAARRRAIGALEAAAYGPSATLRPALAKIETARAVGEGPDFPLLLGLTVALDDRPGYRVEITANVNLMDMDSYRAGRVIVVACDPEHPWRVAIPTPPAEWAARAAVGAVDSAPRSALVVKPTVVPTVDGAKRPRGFRPGLYAMAVGVLASVAVFWPQFSA